MNVFQKYIFYVNLYNQLKKFAPELCDEQEKFRGAEVLTRTRTWAFQEYVIRDIYDTKYDWHTVRIDNKKDNKQIAEFDGLPANIFLKRLQKSK